MFKSLSLGRQIIVLFIAIALVAVVLMGVTTFYKNNIESGVVKDLTIDANKQEGEAIEQANDIDAMHSQLSDSAVDAGLLLDFRSEDQPSERVQSVSSDQTSQSGYNGHKTTGVQTQQPIPQPLPSEATEQQEAWQPSIEPCYVTYGFDENREIIEFKVCE